MPDKAKKKSFWKWFFRILLILIIIGLGLFLWKGDYLLEKAITDKLYEDFLEIPTGNYDYDLEQIDINIYTRNVSLREFKLYPKKEFLESLMYKQPESYFKIFSTRSIELNGLRLIRFLRTGVLSIAKLELDEPDVHLNLVTDTTKMSVVQTRDKLRTGIFNLLSIDRLQLQNARISCDDLSDNMNLLFKVDSIYLNARNIKIDTSALKNKTPAHFKNLSIKTGTLQANLPNNQFVHIDRFVLNTKDKLLYADSIKFLTKGFHPEKEQFTNHESAFRFINKEMIIQGFEFEPFYLNRDIIMDRIDVEGLNTLLYLPMDQPDESDTTQYYEGLSNEAEISDSSDQLLPSSIIRALPFDLSIQKVNIQDASLFIKQFSGQQILPGELLITEARIVISNLAKYQKAIKRNQLVHLSLDGKLMDTSQIYLTLDLPIGDTTDRCELYGKLGTMPYTTLNKLTENAGVMRITSGQIDSLECNIVVNKDSAWGGMSLVYHDLHIHLLKESDRIHKPVRKRPLVSLVANNLIRNNNDPEKSSYRPGIIKYHRGSNEPISSYLVHCFTQGLVTSMAPGVDESRLTDQDMEK